MQRSLRQAIAALVMKQPGIEEVRECYPALTHPEIASWPGLVLIMCIAMAFMLSLSVTHARARPHSLTNTHNPTRARMHAAPKPHSCVYYDATAGNNPCASGKHPAARGARLTSVDGGRWTIALAQAACHHEANIPLACSGLGDGAVLLGSACYSERRSVVWNRRQEREGESTIFEASDSNHGATSPGAAAPSAQQATRRPHLKMPLSRIGSDASAVTTKQAAPAQKHEAKCPLL